MAKAQTHETTEVAHHATSEGLGSLGSLFSESMDLFKKSWSKQLVLALIVSLLSFVVVVLAVVMFAVMNAPQLPGLIEAIKNNGAGIETLLPAVIGTGAVVFGVAGVVLWLLTASYAAGMLMLVQAVYKKHPMTFSEALKKGFGKLGPMLVLGLASAFCILGGYWLLVVPGLIMAIYLSYSTYEVAIADQSPLKAMKQSISIVGSNFWGILGRILLIGLLCEAIMLVSTIFGRSLGEYGLDGIWSIVEMVLQFAMQFFVASYSIVLYNRAKAASAHAKPASLKLMVVTAVLGWVFAVVVGGAVISALKTALPMIQDAVKEAELEQETTGQFNWEQYEQLNNMDVDVNIDVNTDSSETTTTEPTSDESHMLYRE